MTRLFLHAIRRSLCERQAPLAALAAELGVSVSGIFGEWMRREMAQTGTCDGGAWRYWFHGYECELSRVSDGLHLRIDFGPGGRTDTFTAWGVLAFLASSGTLCPEFDPLRDALAGEAGDLRSLDASSESRRVCDRLQSAGYVESASAELIDLGDKHTTVGDDGLRYLRLPAHLSETLSNEIAVAHRLVLTAKGLAANEV